MRIVYAPGVFDLLHSGHRNFLRRSRELGDFLIAAVLTDEGAEAYKRRPVQPLEERRGNVADLPYVDLAIVQGGTNPTLELSYLTQMGLKPEILTHGDDWPELRSGMETLNKLRIEYVTVPYTHGVSTTETIARLPA